MRRTALFLASVAILFAATPSKAQEEACAVALQKAAGRYASCQAKAKAKKIVEAASLNGFSKCRARYAATWPKLGEKYPSTSCDAPRFVDNGSTVTDNLTRLVWEKKTNLDATVNFSDPHDADNFYSWAFEGDGDDTDGDGSAFATFLLSLNQAGGFASANDWRIPTADELSTIVAGDYPCASSPCIDPLFGPTVAITYWSATTFAGLSSYVWKVDFEFGAVTAGPKNVVDQVRAVRGGL